MSGSRFSLVIAASFMLGAPLANAQSDSETGSSPVVQSATPTSLDGSQADGGNQLRMRSGRPVPVGYTSAPGGRMAHRGMPRGPGAGPGMMPGGPGAGPGMMPGGPGAGPGMMPGGPRPAYVPGAGGRVARASYDQPNLPGYAWPSYAAHPNYAALTYPKQYSPTAWPFIGPFYPYPQVPLGWRKVTMEWDDGWWMLDFKD